MSKLNARRNTVMLSTLPLIQILKVISTSSLIVYREVKMPSRDSTDDSLVVVRSARNRLLMPSTAVFSLKPSRVRPDKGTESAMCSYVNVWLAQTYQTSFCFDNLSLFSANRDGNLGGQHNSLCMVSGDKLLVTSVSFHMVGLRLCSRQYMK